MATATISTKFGDINLEFFEDKAQNHVKNFLDLARSGAYNQAAFHRVIPGFMIQGGCPNTKPGATGRPGTGGPGYGAPAGGYRPEAAESIGFRSGRDHDGLLRRGIVETGEAQDA